MCDASSVQRYLHAPNVIELVRSRKTNQIVRVFLAEEESESVKGRYQATPDAFRAALQHSGPCADDRERSRDGLAFEQELSSGRVWALSGVLGSEASGA
jgi:hypothetical protein